MEINIPTSQSVGVMQGLLKDLNSSIKARGAEVTFEEYASAHAVASVAAFVFAAIDVIQNVVLAAFKIVPVLFCETIGKLADLPRNEALTGDDLVGHWDNIRRALLIQMNAISVFFFLQSPELLLTVAEKVKVITDGKEVARIVPQPQPAAPAPVVDPVV